MEYPTTVQAFLTIPSVAIFGGLLTQWLKRYLPDWRFTQLLTLAVCVVVAILAQLIISTWAPSGAEVWRAAKIGLYGGSVATLGYEGINNILGSLGRGPRA